MYWISVLLIKAVQTDDADVGIGHITQKQVLYAFAKIPVTSKLREPVYLSVISRLVDNVDVFMKSKLSFILPLNLKSAITGSESIELKSIISEYVHSNVQSKLIDYSMIEKAKKAIKNNSILYKLYILDSLD